MKKILIGLVMLSLLSLSVSDVRKVDASAVGFLSSERVQKLEKRGAALEKIISQHFPEDMALSSRQ